MSSAGLKRLRVWVEAKDFALLVYKSIIPALPAEEKWGLAQQLRRSATSIAANIAEGYGRFYFQANVQFCYNARGSLEETLSHILLSRELGYITDDQLNEMIKKGDALVQLLNGYIAYLRKIKRGSDEISPTSQVGEETPIYSVESISVQGHSVFDDSQFSTLDSRS
ncbi:MAG: four helix bundle protein [Anaerolineaceae bacterium]|jgi:four helix bundle protein